MKKSILIIMCAVMLGLPSCAQKKNPTPENSEAQAQKADVQKSKYKVKTLPEAVTSNILETIEKEYKGSVALIDVWATWCPPCRRAMIEIDSIKPAYMEKGVKFVYITGKTSPEETWKKMITKIDGDHYRLTDAQWKALMQEQGIPGIPVYKAVNKDGSTAFTNLQEGGFPGNETVKAILDKALK